HPHRHDYVYVTLGAAAVSNEVEGKPPASMKLQDGETNFLPGNFAHIARNLARTPGVIVQLTASALTGSWGENAQHMAEWLLHRNAVHVLASDAHDTSRRTPGLSAARVRASKICGDEVARALVKDNPNAIVNGAALPHCPPVDCRP